MADVLKSMTLRGLDSQLAAKLREVAEREGKSVNQTVLDALRKQFGLDKSRRFTEAHRDLDYLFGRWDEDEFMQIQQKIDSEQRIDSELWQ
ncbi:MAG: antitoxin [Gemmatimonadota bacterium]|nr:antitoxin [Gemmatimonadota bacterium]